MNHPPLMRWLTPLFVCCCLLLPTASCLAADAVQNATPKIDNVGFMKNPPQELVDRFPMCDAFLDVEWIDDYTGYMQHDLYDGEGHRLVENYRELIFFDDRNPLGTTLVNLEGEDRNINDMTKSELHDLFEVLRGEDMFILADQDIEIRNGNKSVRVYRSVLGQSHTSYDSDNTLNVCLPYPDNERMWLVDFKKIGKTYDTDKAKKLKEHLEKSILSQKTSLYINNLDQFNIVDLNFDGHDDFFIFGVKGLDETVLYFQDSQYYEMKPLWESQADEKFEYYMFPPGNKECEACCPTTLYITTDGKNYYLDNQCNLTEMLAPDE